MEINPAGVLLKALERPATNTSNPAFVTGQRLLATVVEQIPKDKQLLLRINGELFRAASEIRINRGETRLVEVIAGGKLPQLRIVQPQVESLQQAIRSNIAVQTRPVELLRELMSAQSLPAHSTGTEPNGLKQVAGGYVQNIPRLDALLSPEGLKQALANSGLFLESRLAMDPPVDHGGINLDLKAQLLKLVARFESRSAINTTRSGKSAPPPAPPNAHAPQLTGNIQDNARGALARLVLDQISSLPASADAEPTWNISLPFIFGESAQSLDLKIGRERESAEADQPPEWSVVVELNPPDLGLIRGRISMRGTRVSVHLVSEHPATRRLIETHLHDLDRSLATAGLTVNSLQVSAEDLHPDPAPAFPVALVDEKA